MIRGFAARWVPFKMRLELLPIGQFNNETFEALIVKLLACRILDANAPSHFLLSHEPAVEHATRPAASRPPHHVGSDEQRLPALRFGERRRYENHRQKE